MRAFKKLFTILLVSVLCFSCSKADSVNSINDRIDGVWKVNSFKLNSIETIGFVINEMTLEFASGDDGRGISKWIIDMDVDDPAVATYQLENDGEILSYSDGDFELYFDKKTLILDGRIDDDEIIIRAVK